MILARSFNGPPTCIRLYSPIGISWRQDYIGTDRCAHFNVKLHFFKLWSLSRVLLKINYKTYTQDGLGTKWKYYYEITSCEIKLNQHRILQKSIGLENRTLKSEIICIGRFQWKWFRNSAKPQTKACCKNKSFKIFGLVIHYTVQHYI